MSDRLQADLYDAFVVGDVRPVVDFLRWLVGSYGLSEPLEVLDIGCGTGRLLRPLANLGWSVVGMEPDPDYLSRAIDVAGPLQRVEVRDGGFADLDAEESFDLIAAVNDPFQYLLTVEERAVALARCFHALRPGGILFLDLANFPWILKHYRAPSPSETRLGGWTVHRDPRHEIDFHDAVWTHVDEFTLTDERGTEKCLVKVHRFAILTLPELVVALRSQGFEDLRTFNGYAARAATRVDRSRILVSSRKPRSR